MFEVFLKQKPPILALFHSLLIIRLSLALAYSSLLFRTELGGRGCWGDNQWTPDKYGCLLAENPTLRREEGE